MPKDLLLTANLITQNEELKKILTDITKNMNIAEFKMFIPYENDIFIQNKDIVLNSGISKVSQNIFKAFYTQPTQNIEDEEYGGGFKEFVGRKIDNSLSNEIVLRLKDVLTKYNELNSDNPDASEIISSIDGVNIFSYEEDPRVLIINANIRVKAGEMLNLSFLLEI